jgi:predicted acylesterase/phospholipase RssA
MIDINPIHALHRNGLGLDSGDKARGEIAEQIRVALGFESAIEAQAITLEELQAITGKRLVVSTTDLVTRRAIHLDSSCPDTRRVRVCDAVYASMAIPTLYEPLRMGKHLLCDGGLIDNFPMYVWVNCPPETVLGFRVHAVSPLMNARTACVADILQRVAQMSFQSATRFQWQCMPEAIRSRVITINVSEIKAFDSHLTATQRNRMLTDAKAQALDDLQEMFTFGRRVSTASGRCQDLQSLVQDPAWMASLPLEGSDALFVEDVILERGMARIAGALVLGFVSCMSETTGNV